MSHGYYTFYSEECRMDVTYVAWMLRFIRFRQKVLKSFRRIISFVFNYLLSIILFGRKDSYILMTQTSHVVTITTVYVTASATEFTESFRRRE